MDTLQSQIFPFPTTMKIQWDGEVEMVKGKGSEGREGWMQK